MHGEAGSTGQGNRGGAVGDSGIRGRALVNGIPHLALTTEDIRITADFFVDVLGMPLARAARLAPGMGKGPLNIGNPPFERIRYYFLRLHRGSRGFGV